MKNSWPIVNGVTICSQTCSGNIIYEDPRAEVAHRMGLRCTEFSLVRAATFCRGRGKRGNGQAVNVSPASSRRPDQSGNLRYARKTGTGAKAGGRSRFVQVRAEWIVRRLGWRGCYGEGRLRRKIFRPGRANRRG